MRRSSLFILAGVGLFVLGLVAVLVIRARTTPSGLTDSPPTKADYRIKEVHLQEAGSGNLHWTLDADQAEVFEREGKTLLRRVSITIRGPERSWHATAEEGDLIQPARDVTIRKNVVVTSSDGLRLETEVLRWEADERKVWTEVPVTLYQKGVVVTGRGLEHNLDEDRTRVTGRVRATFSKAPAASPGSQPR